MTDSPKMTQPTEAGQVRFDAVVEELGDELDIVATSMFGMPSVKRGGGKAFGGLYGDDVVFKLDGDDVVFKLAGDAHARALALDGARLFELMAG